MAKSKNQKEAILAKLKEKLTSMKSVVFANFSGIGVKDIESLRKKCREEGSEYLVAKKTLLKKALLDNGYEYFADQEFAGEVAAIFGDKDEVVPARLVSEFAKNHEQMKILAGILEGKIIDENKVDALSKLPGRDELIAKVVGSIAAPLSGMVNVLQGNLRNFVYVLGTIKEKKS